MIHHSCSYFIYPTQFSSPKSYLLLLLPCFLSRSLSHFYSCFVTIIVVMISRLLIPLISALDHTRILGSTVEEIAQKKAGIFKKGVPALVGPGCPLSVLQVIIMLSPHDANREDETNCIAFVRYSCIALYTSFHLRVCYLFTYIGCCNSNRRGVTRSPRNIR